MLLSIPEHMNPFYLCPYAQPLAQADPTKPDLGIMMMPFLHLTEDTIPMR
jgi:hypothetical protein